MTSREKYTCVDKNRRKEVMRIGDDNLFEIGCRKFRFLKFSNLYVSENIV